MKANILKHVECGRILFEFSNYFKIDNIEDDIIVNMLENIENKLLNIGGNKNFIIIRRISDNKIYKFIVS